MLTWIRNGVVILLLIGTVFQSVEGLNCYECGGCTRGDLKGKEIDCNKTPDKNTTNKTSISSTTNQPLISSTEKSLDNSANQTLGHVCFQSYLEGDDKALRGCYPKRLGIEDEGYKMNDCVKISGGFLCFCDGDLCNRNRAKLARAPSTLITVTLILSAVATITGNTF